MREQLQQATVGPAKAGNALLAALPAEEFEILRPFLRPFELRKGMLLADSNNPIAHLYFLESGVVSITTHSHADGGLEVAMIGKTGLVGASVILGVTTSGHRACVQISGKALRIASDAFVRAMENHPSIRKFFLRYVQSLIIQISQTAFCNAKHDPKEKIARWLLLAHESAGRDSLTVTHALLGRLLNTRRAAVTDVLCELESDGVVSKTRGSIRICDHQRLADQCCSCVKLLEAAVCLKTKPRSVP